MTAIAIAQLRQQREAAGVTIDDLAQQLSTCPRIGHLARVQWIEAIEAGTADADLDTIGVIAGALMMIGADRAPQNTAPQPAAQGDRP